MRPSAAKRGYGRRWQVSSKAYLAKHTECVECRRQGLLSVSEVVDHIVPHRGDMQIFWLRSNWQALCKACHDRKTARGE
jgi:5-methylcytosine-specific restriction protein A